MFSVDFLSLEELIQELVTRNAVIQFLDPMLPLAVGHTRGAFRSKWSARIVPSRPIQEHFIDRIGPLAGITIPHMELAAS